MHFKSTPILFILLFWKCVFSINGIGQNIPHKIFTTEQGLPGNTVYDMLQDNKGYMWFATGSGVSRFDGRHFVNFSIKDGLTDLDVLELFQDSKGRIWFLSLNGSACYWLDGKIYNEETVPYLAQVRLRSGIVSMQEDKHGTLWIGGVNFAYACIHTDNRVETFRAFHPHVNFMIDDLGELMLINEDIILLKTDQGFKEINRIRPPGMEVAVTQNLPGNEIMLLDSSGIVATNSKGLFRPLVPIEVLPIKECRNLINLDTQGNLFMLAKEGGVFLMRKGATGYSMPVRLFNGYMINRVFRDEEGNLWMSTIGSGVLFVPVTTYNSGIESYWTELADKRISAIASDQNQRLVVGCSDGTVLLIEEKGSKIISGGDPTLGSNVNDFFIQENRFLWCSGKGTYTYQNERVVPMYTRRQDKPELTFLAGKRCLFQGPDKSIFSSYYGIYSWKNDVFDLYLPDIITMERINYPTYDSYGNLWFDQGEELFKFSAQGELINYDHLRKYFRGKITGIHELDLNTMLISTYGSGVYLLRNDSLMNHIDEENGLVGDICREVSVIGDTILVSTNQGLSVLVYSNQNLELLQQITIDDGLPTNDIKCATIYNGCYQIGTTHGLFSVPVSISSENSIPPRLYLSSLRDFAGNDLNYTSFSLSSDGANILADFAAVTFTSPAAVVYRYRLKENDPWINTIEPNYSFSNLSPGDYQFEVQARKHNSDWSIPVKIPFSIKLPWYKSAWFIIGIVVLIAIVIILLIIYVFNQRNLRSRLQLEKLEGISRERLRIASDVHDDLGADLSNLLLESRISGLDGKISESERGYYQKLESVAESALEKVDEIIWSLDPKEDNLEGFQSHVQKYFESFLKTGQLQGQFYSNLDDHQFDLGSSQRRQLFLCVKEVLHNIQKHANASTVQFDMRFVNQKLSITITDDGVGFDQQRKDSNLKGYGLDSILRRLDSIHGDLKIDTNNSGTTHVLTVHLKPHHP